MPTWPALVVFGATVAIGLYMGLQYLRGVRNNRMLVGVHVLIGVAGLEVFALLLRGAPDGTHLAESRMGPASALLLAAALFTGFLVPLIAAPKPAATGPALAVHAVAGTIGFGALLLWVLG
ncbi:hypothetical protein [Polymorphobacter fuscus]|nr:hypothetical protein [Polymorphobacter fuscus]